MDRNSSLELISKVHANIRCSPLNEQWTLQTKCQTDKAVQVGVTMNLKQDIVIYMPFYWHSIVNRKIARSYVILPSEFPLDMSVKFGEPT